MSDNLDIASEREELARQAAGHEMTDIEIDRALALAIGYQATKVQAHESLWVFHDRHGWRVFTHRDWNVIGPIAARYDAFPCSFQDHKGIEWGALSSGSWGYADTPQKAIALAVINGAKK